MKTYRQKADPPILFCMKASTVSSTARLAFDLLFLTTWEICLPLSEFLTA
jgi:hypothetical protein